jgi:hypothetical protein
MAEESGEILVELYENYLTDRKDDRVGRVVITRHYPIDELIKFAVSQRTDLNAVTLKASYMLLRDAAIELMLHGASTEFGLGNNHPVVNGIFIGDHPKWDPEKNEFSLSSTLSPDVRKATKKVKVKVLGMAQSGTYINTLTDVTSGEVNSRITPGGGVNLSGIKIEIAGNLPGTGLKLINQETGEETEIPKTSILTNLPSALTFIVPANLPAGNYKLSLATQFMGRKDVFLKEIRTYVFEYVLACV